MSLESPSPILNFRQAAFKLSAETLNQCPADSCREAAFVGRSNAGKSSAINALTGQQKLARTSKTPGRTQLFNFFAVADEIYLVDLPGFGYAQVPAAVKRKWQQQLEAYLQERRSLQGLVLLMDCRHPFKDFDKMMLTWCHQCAMPVHILLTKADKLKSGAKKATLMKAKAMSEEYGDLVTIQLFSALKKEGIGELNQTLQNWLTDRPAAGTEESQD